MKLLRDGREFPLPARAPRLLLALLTLRRGQALSRLELQTTLWPEATSESSSRALRQALWRLRAAFEKSPVSSEGATLTLDAPWLESDVEGFLQATQQDPLRALKLYTGAYLLGEDHPWALEERETLLERWKGIFETGAAQLERHRDWPALLECCEQALVRVPSFELAQQTRLLALRQLSRSAEAEREQTRLEGQLERALDLQPPFPSPSSEVTPIFLGRHPEKRQLQAQLEAAKKGRGRLLRLEGAAGSGKSRLLEEFAQSAHDQGFEVYWVRGPSSGAFQSLDLTLGQTLSPLRLEWLRLRLNSRTRQTVARVIPSLSLLAEDWDEGSEQTQALTSLFVVLSETGPQVWLWDSLETLDAQTLEQIPAWAESLSLSSSLWVMSYRTEENAYSPVFRRTLERLNSLDTHYLTLKVLELVVLEEWAELALGAVPEGWASALHRVTAGLPELVALCLQMVQTHPKQPLFPLDLPESCVPLLEHRISALTPDLKIWLQGAAVWGQGFTFADFPAWSDLDAANLLTLESLINWGWIFSEDSGYFLSSPRLKQVLLGGLTPTQKRNLYARAARFLEKSSLELGRICDHFAQANEWEEVARVVPEAIQQALTQSDAVVARHFLDLALSTGVMSHLNLETLQELILERAKLCERQGDLKGAFSDVDALERLAPPNSEARLHALLERTRLEARYRPEQQPEKTLERLLKSAIELNLPAQQAEALMQLGALHSLAGRLSEALEQHERALKLFLDLGLQAEQTQAQRAIGMDLMRLSRNHEAEVMLIRALMGFRSLDNLSGQGEALHVLGTLCYRQGQYPEAEAHFLGALHLEQIQKNAFGEARNLGSLALIQVMHYQFVSARESLEQVVQHYERLQSVAGEVEYRLRLATLQVEMLGHWEAAQPHLDYCLQKVVPHSLEWVRACALQVQIALEKQDFTQAQALLESWEAGLLEDDGARVWPTLYRMVWARRSGQRGLAQNLLDSVGQNTLSSLAYNFVVEEIRLNLLEQRYSLALEKIQSLDEEAHSQNLEEVHALKFEALWHLGARDEALQDLDNRYTHLEQALFGLTLQERTNALSRVELWRELHHAWTTHLTFTTTLRLPRHKPSTARPNDPMNHTTVTFTVETAADRRILNKPERRLVQFERLLGQAREAGVVLTLGRLAELMGVSRMTVRRDLSKLKSGTLVG